MCTKKIIRTIIVHAGPASPELSAAARAAAPPPAHEDSDVVGPYGEALPYDLEDANVMNVTQDDLRKSLGMQKQYDFVPVAPIEEVKTKCLIPMVVATPAMLTTP